MDPYGLTSGIPEGGGQYVGAVGQLVAAVLQTRGLFTQTDVLNSFAPVFISLGAYIYIFAFLGGLFSLALFGNYRKALMLVICPWLFLWLLNSRTEVDAAEYKFGNRAAADSRTAQLTFIRDFLSDQADMPSGRAKVSAFYYRYDRVVSSIVQNIVALLVDTKGNEDLLNVAQERVLSRLALSNEADPRYIKLVSLGLMGHCAQVTELSRSKAETEQIIAAVKGQSQIVREERLPHLEEKLEKINAELNLKQHQKNVQLDPDLQQFTGAADKNVNCSFLWAKLWEEGERTARALFAKYSQEEAEKLNLPDWEALKQRVGDPANPQIARIMAGYLLKNAIRQTQHDALTSQIFSRTPFAGEKFDLAFRRIARADAEGGHLSLVQFAGTIPYIQGLLLYLLSATFPFFCFFMLLPHRMSAFFVWMALWAWVKSWDVGFAAVHFARELLWRFVNPFADSSIGHLPPSAEDQSPLSAMLYVNDPTGNLSTYFTIIAVITLGIPYITAHFCLGATNLFDTFKNSIDQNANKFGKAKYAKARREQATRVEGEINWRTNMAGLDRANGAAGNGGGTTGTGDRRILAGDGTLPRHLQGEYQRGTYDYHFGEENSQNQALLAALTGRRLTGAAGKSATYLEALINQHNEQYTTREGATFSGGWTYFGGSDRGSDDRTNIDAFRGVNNLSGTDADN